MTASIGQYTPVFLPGESPDREVWQAIVFRVTESWTPLRQPCVHRQENCFACGSSSPVRDECEGGAAAWLAGTLAVPHLLGHRLPLPQELWPYQSFLSFL